MILWNQKLAFSKLLSKSSTQCDSLFWPGCAALKLDPAVIKKSYELLKNAFPTIGFSSWCCGKPTFVLGSEREKEKRKEQIQLYLSTHGITMIYTLCPNCMDTLRQFSPVTIYSAFPVIAEQMVYKGEKFDRFYFLHDPCPAEDETRQAARAILDAMKISYVSNDQKACCGRKDMLFITNKQASERIMAQRKNEIKNKPVVSYCASCVDAFAQYDVEAYHLLELLFNTKKKRTFKNRIKTIYTKEIYA